MTTALNCDPVESVCVSLILCCWLWVWHVEELSVILDFAFISCAVLTPPFNEDLVQSVSVWKRYEFCFITQQCDDLSLSLVLSERDVILHASCSPSSSLQHAYASCTGYRIHICLHSGPTGCKFLHKHIMRTPVWFITQRGLQTGPVGHIEHACTT